MKLCPICDTNYIDPRYKHCENCNEKKQRGRQQSATDLIAKLNAIDEKLDMMKRMMEVIMS